MLAAFLAGAIVLTAACAAPTHPRVSATPTARPRMDLARLPLPATNIPLLPSPDGSLIAETDTAQTTVTLYDLQGQTHGSYTMAAGAQPVVAWVSDSSSLLIWAMNGDTYAAGSLVLLDRQAHVIVSGLNGTNAALSPDDAWIAFTYLPDDNAVGDVEVVARTGGAARVLAHNGAFLGWQHDHIVYYAAGSIFAISPAGGSATLLTTAPNGSVLQAPFGGPISSPDGQVLLITGFTTRFSGALYPYILVGTHLRKSPVTSIVDPMPWVGPHDVLGPSNEVQIVDIITGAVVRDTGIEIPGTIQAVAGGWILWTDSANNIHVVNFQTKAAHTIGTEPVQGFFTAFGPDRFLLQSESQGQAYIIDPALAR